ncbi:UPF0496 protein 4-like [Gastrolobium bilobum]|uniref:UPF0496 protein 4-like n=1 Tax=Gastrolobium bilobum TaxID=150636 RepID=UPI002AAF171D|nr:UPF0496 protein 4-like [Gastrolobium bilobum]
MVLLVQKFAKLYTKLENHHHHHTHTHKDRDHHQSDELSASLQAFRSEVSTFIGQLALDLKPGSEILSLSWIEKCFGLLSITNKAFAKLVVDIDYPMSIWEVDSIERYLSYSLCLVELFNSISSSLSHLGQARLSLSHGLTLLENSPSLATRHLKAIQPGCFSNNFGKEFYTEDDKASIFSGKERVVDEAVKEMKSIGFWVCGILLSGLCSDGKPYMELRKMAGGFDGSSILTLDSKICEELMEKTPMLKEVKEINDAVADLLEASDEVKHDAAKELQTKLHVFEKLSDVVKTGVDEMFSKVMTQRSDLIDCFRQKETTLKIRCSISHVKMNKP